MKQRCAHLKPPNLAVAIGSILDIGATAYACPYVSRTTVNARKAAEQSVARAWRAVHEEFAAGARRHSHEDRSSLRSERKST